MVYQKHIPANTEEKSRSYRTDWSVHILKLKQVRGKKMWKENLDLSVKAIVATKFKKTIDSVVMNISIWMRRRSTDGRLATTITTAAITHRRRPVMFS